MSNKFGLKEKVKLTSYDDLFGKSDASGQVVQKLDGELVEIPLEQLHAFKNHPFKVLDDEKMQETVESIRKYGVLVPGMARPRQEGGFEILSGHRRKHASEICGLKTMPMIIRECSDDEGTVIMVDANIQREDILPSEKAKAYRMKYDAMKHQGTAGGSSMENIGDAAGESWKTVQRFIRLSYLSDELLDALDNGKFRISQGVDLSYLDEEAQNWVYGIMSENKCSISAAQSVQIKMIFKNGKLTEEDVQDILCGVKEKARKITLNERKLDSYFTPDYSIEQIEEIILHLLEEWKNKKEAGV